MNISDAIKARFKNTYDYDNVVLHYDVSISNLQKDTHQILLSGCVSCQELPLYLVEFSFDASMIGGVLSFELVRIYQKTLSPFLSLLVARKLESDSKFKQFKSELPTDLLDAFSYKKKISSKLDFSNNLVGTDIIQGRLHLLGNHGFVFTLPLSNFKFSNFWADSQLAKSLFILTRDDFILFLQLNLSRTFDKSLISKDMRCIKDYEKLCFHEFDRAYLPLDPDFKNPNFDARKRVVKKVKSLLTSYLENNSDDILSSVLLTLDN